MDLARCLFVSGRSFVTGAHMIVKSNHRREYRTDSLVIFPTAMLVAHAVEVYLKAWLARSDARYTERVLKSDFGHDLRKLYAEAMEQEMVEPDVRIGHRFLDLIETYEKEHGDYSFRYFHEGLAFGVPKNDVLFAILTRLDQTVAGRLGDMGLHEVDWTVGPDEDFHASH